MSNQFWTSSGVSAGIDMASAFLRHFLDQHLDEAKAKEIGDRLLGVLEVTSVFHRDTLVSLADDIVRMQRTMIRGPTIMACS